MATSPTNNDENKDREHREIFPMNFTDREISHEMESCYLDYAMSVIVSRALPDVRDGLKPVHRRILYVMNQLGLRPNAKFVKSARVVGDVLGKYHPHGDSAVYEAMVRMAQDFSMRYALVNGQGNFGSIDGDSAAAMRYTEVKMAKITEELLADIEKETVSWTDNFDGTLKEPTVLPTKIPQLLLNGTMGIAVGMATNIPPHNLAEVIDALLLLADDPEANIDEIMEYIKGPDFPTGGKIYDINAIKTMYATGRGGIVIRAKAEIEEKSGGKFQIIVTEIPYQINKSTLIEKIAELVRDKKINDISDIRDESNREGIRIVIELKRSAYPKKILNQLFKLTNLQSSFNMNMIALIDGIQPKLMNLHEILSEFIGHRKIMIVNRTKYELRLAEERLHILEGLKKALDHIDEVIATIKKSATKEDAHAALCKKFRLSDKQATAILEMRLQTLAGLERKKIDDEYKEKVALIKELESILKNQKKVIEIMKRELIEIKQKYADDRKTEIIPEPLGEISAIDTVPNEPMMMIMTKENYVKRVPPHMFRSQGRGGKGIMAASTKEEDEISHIVHAKNLDQLLFFTNLGRVFGLLMYEIPQGSRIAKGVPIVNLLNLNPQERVTTVLHLEKESPSKYLLMATVKGTVKKTVKEEFKNLRRSGLIAIKLREGDSLEWVKETNPKDKVILVTKYGKCSQFDEEDIRPSGRTSMGVRGIRLSQNDKVVEMDVCSNEKAELLVVTERGLGKRTPIKEYRLINRGGSGVKTLNMTKKTGAVIGARITDPDMEGDLIIVSKHGQMIRVNLKQIPGRGRATQGVYLMRMNEGDMVASFSLIAKSEEKTPIKPEALPQPV